MQDNCTVINFKIHERRLNAQKSKSVNCKGALKFFISTAKEDSLSPTKLQEWLLLPENKDLAWFRTGLPEV